MRVERVARPRLLKIERQALLGGELRQPRVIGEGLFAAHAVLGSQPLGVILGPDPRRCRV